MANISWIKYNCSRQSNTGYDYTETNWELTSEGGYQAGDSISGYDDYYRYYNGTQWVYGGMQPQVTLSASTPGVDGRVYTPNGTIVTKETMVETSQGVIGQTFIRSLTTFSYVYYTYEVGEQIGTVTAAVGTYPEEEQGYTYVTTTNGYTIMQHQGTYYAYLNSGVVEDTGYIYIGVNKEFPVYEKYFNVNIDNISECFTVDNGETYYFAGSGGVFTSNNSGQANSRASTTLTALFDMNISFGYSYSSESNYDKFTLTIGDTTIENAVSGATTTKTYSGSLTTGQSITFIYSKDGTQNSNDDKCMFYNMVVTSPEQIGTEIRSLAHKVKSCYIGGSNGVARKITKGYIGVNGVARLFYTAHVHAYLSNDDYDFDDGVSEDQHYYTKTCSCGDTITIWEDHGYEEREEEATCTSDGFYTEFCPKCFKEFSYETYDALGHNPGPEATCTTAQVCTRCRATLVDALGHTIETVEWVSLEPTCTEEGIMNYSDECSVCGEEIGGWSEPISALGHNYVETINQPYLCQDGTLDMVCSRCGDSYTVDILPAFAEHKMVDTGVIAPEGTYWKCLICGYVQAQW